MKIIQSVSIAVEMPLERNGIAVADGRKVACEYDILRLDVGFIRKIVVIRTIHIRGEILQVLLRGNPEGVVIRTPATAEQLCIESLHSFNDSRMQRNVIGSRFLKLPAVRAIDLQGEAAGI